MQVSGLFLFVREGFLGAFLCGKKTGNFLSIFPFPELLEMKDPKRPAWILSHRPSGIFDCRLRDNILLNFIFAEIR
jgi:hypothetical protein